MLPRFFADAALTIGDAFRLPDDAAHHALHVLRLRSGAPIVLFNGRGGEYRARLATVAGEVVADIDTYDPVERESPLKLTLLQALVAAEKLDWIVEKAVELGVDAIAVAPARRSVVRLDAVPPHVAARSARAAAACRTGPERRASRRPGRRPCGRRAGACRSSGIHSDATRPPSPENGDRRSRGTGGVAGAWRRPRRIPGLTSLHSPRLK